MPPSLTVAICRSRSSTSTSASVWICAGENFAGFVGNQTDGFDAFADHLERNLLQVQDDVGGVFDNARDGAEFVIHAFDADRGDGGAFDARKQHAAQRIADGGTETALERLGGELPVTLRQGLGVSDQTFGFLKALEHTFYFTPINGVALSQSAHAGFLLLLITAVLLAVQLDDQLFVDRDLDQFVAARRAD